MHTTGRAVRAAGTAVAVVLGVAMSGCLPPSVVNFSVSFHDVLEDAETVWRTVVLSVDVPGSSWDRNVQDGIQWAMGNFTYSARKEGWNVSNASGTSAEITRRFRVGTDRAGDGPFTKAFQPRYHLTRERHLFIERYRCSAWLQGDIIVPTVWEEGSKLAVALLAEYGLPASECPEIKIEYPVSWTVDLPGAAEWHDSGELGDDGYRLSAALSAQEFGWNMPTQFTWTKLRAWPGWVASALGLGILALIGMRARQRSQRLARRY